MNQHMEAACIEAMKGCSNNEGGPFGAVIVKEGNIIAACHNEVLKNNDPTAHAEIMAIRKASAVLNRFDLSDCEIYTTCEPCPMCLAAIYWARINHVYYGCTRFDAAEIGFDDNAIYEFIKQPERYKDTLELVSLDRNYCMENFKFWQLKEDKVCY